MVGGLVVVAVLIGRWGFSTPQGGISLGALTNDAVPKVQSGYVPSATEAARVGASATATPVPQLRPTPEPASNARHQIARTDGQGVVLRATPRDDDRTPRGFMDGDWVTVMDRSGSNWALVQGDNGQKGWIPAQYLAGP